MVVDEQQPSQPSLLTPEAARVAETTICIVVRKGRFGTRRKASTAQVDVETDKKLISLSKRILESPELQKVAQKDGEVATFLGGLCLRSMFKGGVYLIPLGLVDEVNTALESYAAQREVLVNDACATYAQRIRETSERLDVLSDLSDYPPEPRFRSKFYFEWQFVTFETPTRLRAIRPALFELERQKAAAKLSSVADDCRLAMRAGMKQLVDHIVERLQPDDDGKKKRFGKSTVKNFEEFFRTFALRNVTDDSELAGIVTQAQQLLNGVDVELLKSDEAVRNAIHQQFEALRSQLVPMTVGRGDRDIDLEEDEDA